MKRFVSICLIILLAICTFASCADTTPEATNTPEVSATPEVTATPEVSTTPQVSPTSQASGTPVLTPAGNFVATTTDDELNEIVDLALGLITPTSNYSSVIEFSSPSQLSSFNLFEFFARVTPYDEMRLWYKEENRSYHVPAKNITAVLDEYLDRYTFDPNSVFPDSNSYNEAEDILTFLYFGVNWPYECKTENVEAVSDEMVGIDIAYYDWSLLTEPILKMRLTIKITDDGYRYISFIETEPEAASTPGPYATAQDAYLADISSVLEVLDDLEEKYPGEIMRNSLENSFSGALEDLDGDEQPELIIAYYARDEEHSLGAYYYKIYTFKAENSVLVKSGTLFVDAGAPRGGLSVVDYNGEQYLCAWNTSSHPGDTDLIVSYSCELFVLENTELISRHIFDFTFHATSNGEPLSENPRVYRDGAAISFEEFLQAKNDFDNPVKELCTVGKRVTNYRLRQLYEDLKNS